MVAELLSYAVAHESAFVASRIGSGASARQDATRRVSAVCRNLGALHAPIEERILARVADFTEVLGLYPFATGKIEIELAAHGDGAFFSRHVDTQRDVFGSTSPRVLSAVYYFHSQPRKFSGGELRLYDFATDGQESYVDIAPLHDSLLVFPSYAPHEVLPVCVPQGRFEYQRFALNIWIHKAAPPAGS